MLSRRSFLFVALAASAAFSPKARSPATRRSFWSARRSQSAACSPPYPSSATFIGNLFQPIPGKACPGNSGRNAFTGPDYVNMNFAVQKKFHLSAEGKMLIFRMEFYNLFDRANYYNPISTYSTDGVTVNPDFGKIKSAHDPREIQLAIRFTW